MCYFSKHFFFPFSEGNHEPEKYHFETYLVFNILLKEIKFSPVDIARLALCDFNMRNADICSAQHGNLSTVEYSNTYKSSVMATNYHLWARPWEWVAGFRCQPLAASHQSTS